MKTIKFEKNENIEIDEERDKRQDLGVQKWGKSKGNGVLIYPTGFGKTATAFKVLDLYFNYNINRTCIIAVSGTPLARQWQNKLKGYKYEKLIKVITADKLANSNGITCNLLIVDEIHKFFSDMRISILIGNTVRRQHFLGLTATWKDRDNRYLEVEKKIPVVDVISEEKAIAKKWISKYLEFNWGLEFTNDNKDKYNTYTKELSDITSRLGRDAFDIIKGCLNGNKEKSTGKFLTSLEWCNIFKGIVYKNENIILSINDCIELSKKAMRLIRERKKLVQEAKEKILPTIQLHEKFKVKSIIFNETTQFADIVCDALNNHYGENLCTIYHSNIKSRPLINPNTGEYYLYKSGKNKGKPKIFGAKRLKEAALNAIKSGLVRNISAVKSLNEGYNIVDIELILTTSSDQSYISHTQRTGRGKRIDPYKKGAIIIIVNFYMKDTVEKTWVTRKQSESKNQVYWVNNIDDISYTPKEVPFFKRKY